ncbi:universal stress protein [Rhodococcoides fascians A25f]|nr:universal stress protein [Rhodococcus fascians A25f]
MSNAGSAAIVVGVDGSSSSLDAVGWAARAAELRNVRVKLVSVYQVRSLYATPVAAPQQFGPEERAAGIPLSPGLRWWRDARSWHRTDCRSTSRRSAVPPLRPWSISPRVHRCSWWGRAVTGTTSRSCSAR